MYKADVKRINKIRARKNLFAALVKNGCPDPERAKNSLALKTLEEQAFLRKHPEFV